MAERNARKPETAEQLGQQILEFVDQTEFGTAQFQAVSDFIDLLTLQDEGYESVQTKEMEIALLRHRIRQNMSKLNGYAHTYNRIERDFADLSTVSNLEAEQKFSGFGEQNGYVAQMFTVAFNGAEEIISMKKDGS